MDPFSFDADNNFGSRVIPIVTFMDNSIESYLDTLDSSTREAVERNLEQFKSREEVEKFVQGLRG